MRDEHLALKPDQLVWLGVSYQQVPAFFYAFSYPCYHQQLGFRYQYNLMDAGLMLNLLPNVTHQEGVDCANLELVLSVFLVGSFVCLSQKPHGWVGG